MTTFHIVTIFPEMFNSYLGESMIARAVKSKKIVIKIYNLRDFTDDKHKQIDFKQYGGAPGMVFKVEPLVKVIETIISKKTKVKLLFFAPAGKKFTNLKAIEWSKNYNHIVMIAGRYEGIDARVKKIFKSLTNENLDVEEISIGSYVLTGGELPAMVVLDSVSRQIKGVLGKESSLEESRPAGTEIYTRPEVFVYKNKTYKVPKILLSGDHEKIKNWRQKKSPKL